MSSSEIAAVETIKDLLDQAGGSVWQNAVPEVYFQWELTRREKTANPDPALYVWSPTDGALPAFDMEYSSVVEDRFVTVQIWTLDATESAEYQEDVIDYLSEFGRDNTTQTTWNTVRPSNTTDLRNEKAANMTDHYVTEVQIDLMRYRETGQ